MLEDTTFASLLGPSVSVVSLAHLDAPLRGERTWRQVCDRRHQSADEKLLEKRLTAFFMAILRKDDLFLAPAAVGCHIDHLIVRSAAQHAHSISWQTYFYEDLPYGTRHPETEQRLQHGTLASFPIDYGNIKARFLKCYSSQLSESDISRVVSHGLNIKNNSFSEMFWHITKLAV
jgi:hypothetical protein